MQYKETQKFDQWWLSLLLYAGLGFSIYALIQQVIYGIPFGTKPAPDFALIIMAIFMLLLMVFFRYLKLTTIGNKDHLSIQFYPIHRKPIVYQWKDIKAAELVTYKPLLQYGGWGIRYGFKSKAYNVAGNQGVMLKLNNNKQILIGTQNPDEFKYYLSDVVKSID